MPGLFDIIMGGGDQTPDPAGLTRGDRSQLGFNTIGNIGALLMAAGQPMYGPDRARYLAAMGNVPGQMQEQRGQMVQQNRMGQQLEAERRQNASAKTIQDLAKDPSAMEGLTPQQKTIMQAAYATGNPQMVLAAQKEAREASKPIALGNGMFASRNPDGSYTAVNPWTNTRMQLGANGAPSGDATYMNGKPVEPGDDELNPQTGRRDNWLMKQDKWLQDRLQRIANGDEQMPGATSRSPDAIAIRNGLAHYAPDTKEQDYKSKQAMITSATSGPIYQKIILPAERFTNHAVSLTETVDKLDLRDDIVGNTVVNPAKLAFMRRAGGRDAELANAFDTYRTGVTNEFYKAMAGNGQLTDAARKEGEGLKNAVTPGAIKGHLNAMVEMMHGQIDPVANSWAQAMKKPSGTEMIPAKTRDALAKVGAWRNTDQQGQTQTLPDGTPISDGGAPPAAAAAAPQGGVQPVKVRSPEEARKLPKGTPIILPDGRTGVVP